MTDRDRPVSERLQEAVTRALCFATEAQCSDLSWAGRWAGALRELALETREAATEIERLTTALDEMREAAERARKEMWHQREKADDYLRTALMNTKVGG